MDSIKRQARIAGLLYLLVVITGPFILIYVPNHIFVPGDATATVNNILAHQTLYRASIAAGIFGDVLFMFVVLALYRLLKPVDQTLAVLMAALILVIMPLAFLGIANQLAALQVLRDNGNFLKVFDKPQRDALSALLITFDMKGILVSEVFWGLWLLPLGMLVYRSRFLPRFLGVWLFLNGIAYVVVSMVGIFDPEHMRIVNKIATPVFFGEMVLMLWLVIFGARAPRGVVAAG
ncbi:MAG TPA: DUF4386 domain-containing protein [Candidatus Krumholzibacteria bacterium]|nr:DUF4386 domain-containing protein [Candidatus Krumholzibacteria bacterium]